MAQARPPWEDEFWSWQIGKQSSGDILEFHRTPHERNGPLYHLLLHVWIQCFGDSLAMVRSLSIAAAMGSTALLAMFSPPGRFPWAALLFAVNAPAVLFGMQVRMYSVSTFLGLAAIYCLWISVSEPKFRTLGYACFLASAVGSLYFMGGLVIASAAWSLRMSPDKRRRCIQASAAILATFFLWLATAAKAHLFAPGRIAPRASLVVQPRILLQGPLEILKGFSAGPDLSVARGDWAPRALVLFYLACIGILVARALWRARFPSAAHIAAYGGFFYVGGPYLLAGLGVFPFWFVYQLTPAIPFFCILLAAGLEQLSSRMRSVLTAMILAVSLISVARLIAGEAPLAPEWPPAGEYLSSITQPGDEIWVSSYIYTPVIRYHAPGRTVRGYPWDYSFKMLTLHGDGDREVPITAPLPSGERAVVVLDRQHNGANAWKREIEKIYGSPVEERLFNGKLTVLLYLRPRAMEP